MTIADQCPNCNSRRREDSPFPCSHDWHRPTPYKPELVFSFAVPGPQYSKTVSETDLKRMIDEVKLANYRNIPPHEIMILMLAAERMIENEKAPKPKPKPLKLDPARSIRDQLTEMLWAIGLDPDRFLKHRPANSPSNYDKPKEPNSMCMPGASIDHKAEAEQAALHLSNLMKDDLGVTIGPVLLRLWLIERWDKVAKLAHKIHNGAS